MKPVRHPQVFISTDDTPLTTNAVLSSPHRNVQTLCYDNEGWGPLSPWRFDFTPCFLDVLVVALAVFGVVFGGVAALLLARKKKTVLLERNWHFYSKLVKVPYPLMNCLELILDIDNDWSYWSYHSPASCAPNPV